MTSTRNTPYNPFFIARIVTLLLMFGLLLGTGTPALAADGSGIGDVITNLITSITDIIQSVSIGAGILGLSIWAVGKIARPVFPQISQLAANYIPDLMIGLAVVFVASSIVEGIAGAMGSGG